MDKIEDLPKPLIPIVRRAIADCKLKRAFRNIPTEIGHVYVYPSPRGVCWGITSKYSGKNLRRGVEL